MEKLATALVAAVLLRRSSSPIDAGKPHPNDRFGLPKLE